MNNRFENRSKFGRNDGQRFAPPVRVDEELDVTIEAVGEKGDGVAKKDGFVLFIPGVKEGEHVRVKITKVLRKVGFAEVVGKATSEPTSKEEKTELKEPENDFQPSEDDSEDFGDDSEDFKEESDFDDSEEEKN